MLDEDEESFAAETEERKRKDALDHAWAWFKYHAEQRVAMIRFYITALGGAAAGIGVLQQQEQHILCAAVSLFAALMAYCFLHIDKRTADLVKVGERALVSEQALMARLTGNMAFNICEQADVRRRGWPYSYGDCFHLLLRTVLVLFILMTGYSVVSSRHMLIIIHSL